MLLAGPRQISLVRFPVHPPLHCSLFSSHWNRLYLRRQSAISPTFINPAAAEPARFFLLAAPVCLPLCPFRSGPRYPNCELPPPQLTQRSPGIPAIGICPGSKAWPTEAGRSRTRTHVLCDMGSSSRGFVLPVPSTLSVSVAEVGCKST